MSQRRFNPLTGEWLLLSDGRLKRPWQGAEDAPARPVLPAHDPDCYLCPGNTRTSGAVNPREPACWSFDNDFPALRADAQESAAGRSDVPAVDAAGQLFRSAPTAGCCRVLVYAAEHNVDLGTMTQAGRLALVAAWRSELQALASRFASVQMFENRGAQMGASSPHPHGQIWATAHVPHLHAVERRQQAQWLQQHELPMLHTYALAELEREQRLVLVNEHWLVVVPWWATWPFETLLLPRRAVASLLHLEGAEQVALASMLGSLVRAYDGVFGVPFPYSMGWHDGAGQAGPGEVLHAHFYPPLLRSASVRKFMVGYEMLAEAQRDLSPEQAAERLRAAAAR